MRSVSHFKERMKKVGVVFAVAFPQVRRSAALWSSGGQLITLKVNIVLFRTHYRSADPVSIKFESKRIFLMLRFTGLAKSMHLDIQEKKQIKMKKCHVWKSISWHCSIIRNAFQTEKSVPCWSREGKKWKKAQTWAEGRKDGSDWVKSCHQNCKFLHIPWVSQVQCQIYICITR